MNVLNLIRLVDPINCNGVSADGIDPLCCAQTFEITLQLKRNTAQAGGNLKLNDRLAGFRKLNIRFGRGRGISIEIGSRNLQLHIFEDPCWNRSTGQTQLRTNDYLTASSPQ